ncbi:DNA glycosylase AlkZ-like family protein [Kribbella sp.]|uniref:DNA glycosylase AlkZ-like family protein n=1 Tax=Kribbella sp. TaxID=1871183 RepID=UPI002D30B001|nr:crosslink repair DNA glycosylase YcaQ family protein [Kribbella sp.]HZX05824.1 crosslink repair DNA glycosylase YcaQ family protein [Kribbella sp.]
MRSVTREQAIAYRLSVNHLVDRLPPGSQEQAAYVGLQDTAPRDALLGMAARMAGCVPGDWEHPSLIQTYSPRQAVYVLPARDFGVFTLGRLPLDQDAVRRIDSLADHVCDVLAGEERRGANIHGLRAACASGRIALRWDTTSLYVREVPRPAIDVREAHRELCRRHLRYFGPTTPKVYAWWSGLSPADARAVWNELADELLEVDFAGVPAWILATAESDLHEAPPPVGVRLLVASDLRLLGRDREARFIAPGLRKLTPAADTFHPNALLINGQPTAAWGRKGARVDVVLSQQLTQDQYDALHAEVAALPLRNPQLSVRIGACQSQPTVPVVRSGRTSSVVGRSIGVRSRRRRPSS